MFATSCLFLLFFFKTLQSSYMLKKKYLLGMSCLVMAVPMQAQLVINEVMQSNIDCVTDDLNDFPDSWVELYNGGSAAEQLSNYRIGLTDDASKAWPLPLQSVAPGSHPMIFCDKVGSGLHTDFRLESGKDGSIYLFRDGKVVDHLTKMKKQPAPNVAYGRKNDGSETWGYMNTPTPGAVNCGSTCKDLLSAPVFSQPGRVMTSEQPVTLALSVPDGSPSGTVVRYTTDGSEPTQQSTLYIHPLTLTSTTVVRAKLFCEGYISPRSITQSYIFHGRELTLPVVSLVSRRDYFYNDRIGILVDGNYNNAKKNYEYDWRRPVNIEYFAGANENSKVNQLGETRVMGGASRSNMRKSLAVYANKRFGEKRFKYAFFASQRPGITDYKSLALRNAGNDFDHLYMRDALIQTSVATHVDLDWQAYSPAIVYLNGEYLGMLNIRERSNEDNIYSNYDGLEDIDMLENNWELKAGDTDNYNRFVAFYSETGHTRAEFEQWMDCTEYLNLMIMNLFYNNQDFPGNNIVCWRPRTDNGRWRWIAKDTDFGIGLYGSSANYKSIEWFYNPNYDADRAWANKEEHTRLFRRMMDNEDLRREFTDRCAVYMGDFLSEKSVRTLWDAMYERIRTEYPYHRRPINQWWPDYAAELTQAHNWLHDRIPSFYQQLSDFYRLGVPVPLTVNAALSETDCQLLAVSFNDIRLSESRFDGRYFAGQTVKLRAEAAEGHEVKEWDVTIYQGTTPIMTHQTGPTCQFIIPSSATRVVVEAKVGEATAIDGIASPSMWHCSLASGVLQLSHLPQSATVVVYDLSGRRLHRVVSSLSTLTLPVHAKACIVRVGGESVKVVAGL